MEFSMAWVLIVLLSSWTAVQMKLKRKFKVSKIRSLVLLLGFMKLLHIAVNTGTSRIFWCLSSTDFLLAFEIKFCLVKKGFIIANYCEVYITMNRKDKLSENNEFHLLRINWTIRTQQMFEMSESNEIHHIRTIANSAWFQGKICCSTLCLTLLSLHGTFLCFDIKFWLRSADHAFASQTLAYWSPFMKSYPSNPLPPALLTHTHTHI